MTSSLLLLAVWIGSSKQEREVGTINYATYTLHTIEMYRPLLLSIN